MNGALVQAAPLWSTMLLCIPSALHHDVGINAKEMTLSQCSGASVHVHKQSGDRWTSYCLCCRSVVHLSWGQRQPTLDPAVLKPGWLQRQPFWSLLTTTSAPMHEDKLMIPAETSGHALCMWQDHMKRCKQGQVVTLKGPEWADPGHHVITWASCHSRSLAPEAGSRFLNAPHLDPTLPNIKTWSQHLISYYAYYYMNMKCS